MLYLAEAATPDAGSAWLSLLMPLVFMFAILYFLMIRPQQKRQKERTAMLNSLRKGDKVTTIGGLHGTIVELTDDTVVLRVNDVTKMTFERSAINQVVKKTAAADDEEKEDKE